MMVKELKTIIFRIDPVQLAAELETGSHHPTQVNALRLNPSHSIYLSRRDGRLS